MDRTHVAILKLKRGIVNGIEAFQGYFFIILKPEQVMIIQE